METLAAPLLEKARSRAPSPLKSAVATLNVPLAVVKVIAEPKVPSPLPGNRNASPKEESATAISKIPSPL